MKLRTFLNLFVCVLDRTDFIIGLCTSPVICAIYGYLHPTRLGSGTGLRYFYIGATGHQPPTDRHLRSVFQALVRPERLVELIRTDCGYDLEGNSEFSAMRELMAHRHLFAHRSGLVDQQYLDDLRLVTGKA